MNSYTAIQPIDRPIPAQRQKAKRHYGVHPYFTRRPFNVIRDYILRYTREGDCVMDPFGGSGVTAIEAFLENRRGVHNDINPLANFIAQGIADLHKGGVGSYAKTLERLKAECQGGLSSVERAGPAEVEKILSGLPLPENVRLPANSDAERYYDLFSPKQLAALAILKKNIERLPNEPSKHGMLLAWSAAVSKLNRTFLSAKGRAASRGGSSIFSIYRYKVAKEPVELEAWATFEERARNVVAAKREIDNAVGHKNLTGGWRGAFEAHDLDAEELGERWKGKVDYIFTDPPYGGHISYIDLSVLWSHWLGLSPSLQVRQKEIIVGGELKHTEEEYLQRLKCSIRACVKMLKNGRWISIVFQHWNVAYFQAILSTAAESGAELKAAVPQVGDPIWSMHKKKNKETVLAGEMILTFCKTGARRRIADGNGYDLAGTVRRVLSGMDSDALYGESLFNQIVIDAWNKGAINSLSISKQEFCRLIEECGWRYDPRRHCWVKGAKAEATLFGTDGG